MCKMCNCKGGCCVWGRVAHILLLVGGLNWGLVGVGLLLGTNLNVVNLVFGGLFEYVIYVLVGVAALVSLCGCRCKKCKSGLCDSHTGSHSTSSNDSSAPQA